IMGGCHLDKTHLIYTATSIIFFRPGLYCPRSRDPKRIIGCFAVAVAVTSVLSRLVGRFRWLTCGVPHLDGAAQRGR
ncbi:MAG: hypothetical protein M3Y35_18320, partial [Actinomycetota bacterium]|nr:hypothetical protein [Actinomycetota bacterium]